MYVSAQAAERVVVIQLWLRRTVAVEGALGFGLEASERGVDAELGELRCGLFGALLRLVERCLRARGFRLLERGTALNVRFGEANGGLS